VLQPTRSQVNAGRDEVDVAGRNLPHRRCLMFFFVVRTLPFMPCALRLSIQPQECSEA